MENLHQQLHEKKRQEELAKRNASGLKRLQEINSNSKTNWSGNLKDLKGLTKVAESMLNPKDLRKEFEDILAQYDVINVKVLEQARSEFLRKYENDPFFARLFNQYTDLLASEVKKATLLQFNKKNKSQVYFF